MFFSPFKRSNIGLVKLVTSHDRTQETGLGVTEQQLAYKKETFELINPLQGFL